MSSRFEVGIALEIPAVVTSPSDIAGCDGSAEWLDEADDPQQVLFAKLSELSC